MAPWFFQPFPDCHDLYNAHVIATLQFTLICLQAVLNMGHVLVFFKVSSEMFVLINV